MSSSRTNTRDRPPSPKVLMDTIPEAENVYESVDLPDHVYTCLDRSAPSNRSTAKSSSVREILHRKVSLVSISLWLITLIILILGLVLGYLWISAIQSELEVLKNNQHKLNGGTPKVAFTASLTNHTESITLGPYSDSVIVVYKNVITNLGGAYSQSTGIFTAPTRGVYYFLITAFGWNENIPIGVSIYMNTNYYMGAYDGKPGPGRGLAKAITLQLEMGDIVYVKLISDRQIHENGNLYNTFNGHLLFPN